MRLRTRFFIAFAGFSAALLLALAGLGQWAFERGLDQYLGDRQQQMLEQLAADFASYYQRSGSFRGVRLRALIAQQEAGDPAPPLPPGLVLRDAGGALLFGPDLPTRGDTRIVVDGELVGTLALPAHPPQHDRFSAGFQQRQARMVFTGLGIGLLLALLASWLLARHLVRPLETSTRFAGELARGHHHKRLELTRGDEIGLLASSLNQLAHSLEQAAAARERWLADISHELRTPVAVLRGELEALADGVRDPSADRLATLSDEIAHLSHLLDDLHDLALADAGALRYAYASVDLGALVKQSLATVEPAFQQAGLNLTADLPTNPVRVFADATRLRQLCDNLLQNSLRYTDSGGQCRLTLNAADGQACLQLEDSAPGLEPHCLDRLFDPFWRNPATSARTPGGTGLGLAICQRIVTAHNGHISAHATSLGGLCLRITLPLQAQP